MKIFQGYVRMQYTSPGECVTVEDSQTRLRQTLPLHLEICDHSPMGFAWGYEGSGPAQLALAILTEVLGEKTALELHQHFKREIIGTLPMYNDFTIAESSVRDWFNRRAEELRG